MGRDGVDEADAGSVRHRRGDFDIRIAAAGFESEIHGGDDHQEFLVSVWCGANRFLHTEVTHQNEVLPRIFDWDRICGQDTYKRVFREVYAGDESVGIYAGVSV